MNYDDIMNNILMKTGMAFISDDLQKKLFQKMM